MIRFILLLSGLLWTLLSLSQTIQLGPKGITRAVVIGISDYQNEGIPDLEFAHKDAEAFASYLTSPAGGELGQEQIILLTNEQATGEKVGAALIWLLQETKSGDKAIIYFSGHGDVEKDISQSSGYLLCHDCNAYSYMFSEVISVTNLQLIVSEMSLKGAKVFVFTDACRSGNLAGSSIGGPKITGHNLLVQWENEVKLLSCQPDEYSLEDAQWGGGHGAFTYHLLDGLYGMADRDLDQVITLSEITRYLEDKVTKEVAPMRQTPKSNGNIGERIAIVNAEMFSRHFANKIGNLPMYGSTELRSLERDILALTDSTILLTYYSFISDIQSKNFFEPKEDCADFYYKLLLKEPVLKRFHGSLTRTYAAALQDDVQSVLNSLMTNGTKELTRSRIIKSAQYRPYPAYLDTTINLLGERHYMYNNIKARQYFFKALIKHFEDPYSKDSLYAREVLALYYKSLSYEPIAPHTNLFISSCHATMKKDQDSAYYYTQQATKYTNNWVTPYCYMSYFYSRYWDNPNKAKELLDIAMEIDSQNVLVNRTLAIWYFYQKQYKNAEPIYLKTIEKDSTDSYVWQDLGLTYLQQGKLENAENALLNSFKLDSNQYRTSYYLGVLYDISEQYKKSEKWLIKSLVQNPKNIPAIKKLGVVYHKTGNLDRSEQQYITALSLSPFDKTVNYNLASFSYGRKEYNKTLEYLEVALKNGEDDYDGIKKDFKDLIDDEDFIVLMKEYFPISE